MIQIDEIQIKSFKAINELKFDAGSINIITGSNNAGKTSFLESIDLLFNPQNVNKFKDNVGYLLNNNSKTGLVSCTYVGDEQASFEQFSSEGFQLQETRELGIRYPSINEAIEYFVDVVLEIVDRGPDANYFIDRFASKELENEEGLNLQEIVEESVTTLITDFTQDELESGLNSNTIVFDISGDEYPYVYLDEFYDQFKERVVKDSTDIVLSKIDENQIEEMSKPRERTISRVLDDLLVPRFGKGRFVGEPPNSMEGVKFIDDVMLKPSDVQRSNRGSAIRLSNIAEYLRSSGISENLDTFSTDKMVFLNEDGKQEIPYAFMGNGFQAMVGVLWELYNPNSRGNILLLEEIETHMHPGYIYNLVYELIDLVRTENVQIFITTHNVDFINSFFSENITKEEKSYLQSEFKLLQMDTTIPQVFSYDQAQTHIDDLQLDLRGI